MFDFIAEQKITEAIERGELDDLPGAGRPLELDDDALVPEELRLAYRVLKNAGCVPAEIDRLNEISELERLVAAGEASAREQSRAARKLALLKAHIEPGYHARAVRRLAR